MGTVKVQVMGTVRVILSTNLSLGTGPIWVGPRHSPCLDESAHDCCA